MLSNNFRKEKCKGCVDIINYVNCLEYQILKKQVSYYKWC